MRTGRLAGSAAILLAGSLALTACDPPMPPEVAAALAEQTYTCLEGDSSVSAPAGMQDLLYGWADSLSYACVDPEPTMAISFGDETKQPDLEISDYPAVCANPLTVPFAVDAAVLIYQEAEVGALSISPKTLAAVLTGKITNWKQLAEDNPGYEMPNFPLTVYQEVDSVALKAIESYLKLTGNDVTGQTLLTAVDKPLQDNYAVLAEGQVAIVPNSYAVALGLYPASIFEGLDEEGNPVLANPDVAGILSGSTQWMIGSSEAGISVSLDPKKAPVAPEGSDTAPTPYQAIYPVNLSICDSNRNLSRAAARFLLRLDSQGALGISNYTPLPETVRISSLLEVSKGLPTPTPTSTQ